MPRHSMCRADRQEIVIEIFFHSSSPALAQWCAVKGGTSAACGGASEDPTVTHSTVAGERGFSWAVPPQPNWPAGAARLGDRSAEGRGAPPATPAFFLPFFARSPCAAGWSASGICSGASLRPTRGERRRSSSVVALQCQLGCTLGVLFVPVSPAHPPPVPARRGGGRGSGGVGRALSRGGAPLRRLCQARHRPPQPLFLPRPRLGGARLRVPRPCGAVACGGVAGGRLRRRLRARTACVPRPAHTPLGGGGGSGAERTQLIPAAGSVFFGAPGWRCRPRFPPRSWCCRPSFPSPCSCCAPCGSSCHRVGRYPK